MKKEQDDSPAPPPRKLKFAPKAPPRKIVKTVEPKKEPTDSKDETIDKELLAKLSTVKKNDAFGRRSHKNERKANPTQVAFGQVKSLTARSFPIARSHSTDGSTSKAEKDYVEPWDYMHSNYPVTLPMRRPYSGNPEVLDDEEFGEAAVNSVQDESQSNAAEELWLTEKSEEPQMLFFQLPAMLPLLMKPDTAIGTKDATKPMTMKPNTAVDPRDAARKTGPRGSKLTELPGGGFMGKLVVYKSGKVKMKLGERLFDVSAGSDCVFAQDVAAINTNEKQFCVLGELGKRAVVTPDIDSMLESLHSMEATPTES